MKKVKTFVSTLLIGFVLLCSTAFAQNDYDVELKQLRYEYSKIRASVIFFNNSDKHIKHVKIQVALMSGDKVIAIESRFISNLPKGAFGHADNFFWEGTSKEDLNKVDGYTWRITFIK